MPKKAIFLAIFVFSGFELSSAEWSAAPADASDRIAKAELRTFTALRGLEDLDSLLVGSEGWFWLRTPVNIGRHDDAVLLRGTQLAWSAWMLGEKIAEAGLGPPRWRAAPPIPVLAALPADTAGDTHLYMKIYLRRGYGRLPPIPDAGNFSSLKRSRFLAAAESLAGPILALVLGLVLFAGTAVISRRSRFGGPSLLFPAGFFGLAAAVAYVEPVLALFPSLADGLSWSLPGTAALAAWPFALSLWRRSAAAADGGDIRVVSIADWFLSAAASAWLLLDRVQPPQLNRFALLLSVNPLPYYVGLSVFAAFAAWIIRTAGSRPGRIGSLLISLTAAAPSIGFIVAGAPFSAIAEPFVRYGLPASLLPALFVFLKTPESSGTAAIFGIDDVAEGMDEDPVPPAFSAPQNKPEKDSLLRSLRTSLFPESIPWDPRWDIAAARQGHSYPATGFYDVYGGPGNIEGFSFMDAGGEDLESMMFAHFVRSELLRQNRTGVALPKVIRTVHRRTAMAAAAAGRTMQGVVGRFRGDKLIFLTLFMPPLLLKRRLQGSVLSLQPLAGRASNPPLGSAGFAERDLSTMSIVPAAGDTILLYTRSLVTMQAPGGKVWGLRRLAAALRRNTSLEAAKTVSMLIQEVKDFAEVDQLAGPLQLLVIKRK